MRGKFFIFLLFILSMNSLHAQKATIKTTDAYVYSLKQKIKRYTEDWVSYLNKLTVSTGKGDDKQADKKEIVYDANKLFLKKSDNGGVDMYYENIFEEIGIPRRTTGYTSMELLEQFSVVKKYKDLSLSVEDFRSGDLYYNKTTSSYIIKATFLLIATVGNSDDDDVEVFNKSIDLIYTNNSDNAFKIFMINQSDNAFPEGYAKVIPTSEKEDLPGVAFVFDLSPVDAKIIIDDKEYEYIPGEKILTEKGEHTIMILPPNDNYEEINVITYQVKTDTGTVLIKKRLKLKKGSLTLGAGNDCMNGAQASIYRMKEETDYKGKGKNKVETVKLVKEKYPIETISVPVDNHKIEPGNYKVVVGKNGFKMKKMDIAITPAFNTNRTIMLKDLSFMGTVSDVACTMFCPKGGNCCCCNGAGKCRICKGTGYKACHCCEGNGNFMQYGINRMCSTCNGKGKIQCNSCKGNGRCTACKGSGRN